MSFCIIKIISALNLEARTLVFPLKKYKYYAGSSDNYNHNYF
jgi:hypothetical protein